MYTKKKYEYYALLGAATLLAAIALQIILWDTIDPSITRIVAIAGIVFIVLGVVKHKVYGEGPEADERTKKISAFAISYSWVVTLVLVCVLLLLDHFNILRMPAMAALGLTMLVMIAVAVVFQWYLKRKGDIA